MARWRRRIGAAGLSALLSVGGALAQGRTFPSHDVGIEVSVADRSTASVVETYVRDGGTRSAAFEFLDNPCSTVGPVGATMAGAPLALDVSRRGPWTLLDAPDLRPGGGPLQVRYRVRLESADAAVPIVLPAAALEAAEGLRGAEVTLRVTFARPIERASVLLPRLEPSGDRQVWEARLLAIPSMVRLRLPAGRPRTCGRVLPGTAGGLEWRFWVFVATMAAWIPIYFWWFSRRDDSE